MAAVQHPATNRPNYLAGPSADELSTADRAHPYTAAAGTRKHGSLESSESTEPTGSLAAARLLATDPHS